MQSPFVRSAIAGAFILAVAGSAHASTTRVMEVNVPFPFLVNGREFPAGQYKVEEEDFGPSVLLIRGIHNDKAAFVATAPVSSSGPGQSALQFERHENQYRLTSVWESASEGQSVIQRR
jgi:hypothetical protein